MKNKYLLTLLFLISSKLIFSQTITLQPGPSAGKDSRIFSLTCGINSIGCDTTNYGDDGMFQVNAWTWGGSKALCRAFLEFNLSSVNLTSSQVNSAKLFLYFPPNQATYDSHSTLSGSNETYLDRITQSWLENGVRWINQPTTVISNLSSSENRVIIPPTTSSNQDIEIDITAMVKFWLDNPTQNFGMRFALATEQNYRRMTFATSDHVVDSLRPKLIINGFSESGLTASNKNIDFDIFPNPVQGQLKIKSSGFGNKIDCEILTLEGKYLVSHSFEYSELEMIMATDGLSNGLYLIKISDEQGNQKIKKIVIEN
jgi:hypothetical protein